MRTSKIMQLLTIAAITTASTAATASIASAASERRLTICHATASATNPYVVITVDISSIVGAAGHGHSGINVGDIIPAIPSVYAGNNWDAEHQAIFANDCNIPKTRTPGIDGI